MRAEQIYRQALRLRNGLGTRRPGALPQQPRQHCCAAKRLGRRRGVRTGRQSHSLAAAGMPDLWGIAASNLGVSYHRRGDYERARELLGEALALVAAVKNSEIQLYALYNMAHLEWENGAWESGAELYEATASLAQRIGADDVEIGAIAAVGLCSVEGGKLELGP